MGVEIIKATQNEKSTQIKEQETKIGTIAPKISFKSLINLYYGSYIVSGLTDKISTAITSGFNSTDENLLKAIKGIDHSFLNRNKILTGNAFFEVIRNNKGQVVELLPILSDTMEIMSDGDGYRQKAGTDVVYFNAFTPLEERAKRQAIWENSQAKVDELVNTGEGCGFNPNLNEVFHFKNTSLETKHYGSSYFESVIDQLVLIENIDKHHNKGFDNGMIKLKILFSKDNEGFSKMDKEVLKEFIHNKAKGLDKAYSTAVLDKPIGELDIEHELDTNAFISYRTQLMQSVCIALNVPYDMLLNQNSNRSSSEVSMETFNNFTIKPLQDQNLEDFKILFAEGYNVDDLQYKTIDTKNQKEEMEVLVGYKRAGIIDGNEVREKLGLEKREGLDELVNDKNSTTESLLKSEGKSFYDKLTDIENDIGENL